MMLAMMNLLPDLIEMPAQYTDHARLGGAVLLPLALLALVWRGWPAISGRPWQTVPGQLAKSPPTSRRIGDVVIPFCFLVAALGLLAADWGWQLIGFAGAVGWVIAAAVLSMVKRPAAD